MKQDEFRLFKDRLYRTTNALSLALRSCPDLDSVSVEFKDGRRFNPSEMLAALEVVRSECWKFGPPEVQQRHLKDIVRQQPNG